MKVTPNITDKQRLSDTSNRRNSSFTVESGRLVTLALKVNREIKCMSCSASLLWNKFLILIVATYAVGIKQI